MVSRLVLGLQYLLVIYHVHEYRKTTLPLSLIGGSAFGAAFIYLGISLQVPLNFTVVAPTNVI
jgi:hypothetical protein